MTGSQPSTLCAESRAPVAEDILEALRPYQVEGVRWLLEAPRRLLLDEQGLGKTVTAIRAADALTPSRVVIVCPAIARTMWGRAIEQWARRQWDAEIYSFDYFSNGGTVSTLTRIDVLILDEGHYLKSTDSARTRRIYGMRADGQGLVSLADRVWVLSGTLTPNGPHEIYSHLRALFPESVTTQGRPLGEFDFIDRYFRWRRDLATHRLIVMKPREDRLNELRAKVRPHFLRRLTKDVERELPPLTLEHVPLAVELTAGDQQALDLSARDAEAFDAILAALEDDMPLDLDEGTPFATLRRITGILKADAVSTYLRTLLDGGQTKVVVFFHHRNVGQLLKTALSRYQPVLVDGTTAQRARQSAIDAFQTDGAVRIFLGQIQTCGTAITLTAANRAVFAECSWVPAENAQAAKRVHRIGTTRGVLVTFLSLAGSIDEIITRVLERKTRNIRQLWTTNEEKS